jgi:predicted MPP superfamily phosphohydrolase
MTLPFILSVAVLLGLGLFLFNEIRRPDPGLPPRWKKTVRVTLIAIPFLIGCFFFYGVLIEPNRLVLHQETIALNNWPKELDGLRIAVISDIHIGSWFVRDDKLRLIVQRTNELQPDMIVILGDYMSGQGWMSSRVVPEAFGPFLKEFRAPLGVYSVLGNHDWWWDGPRVRRGLEANGIKVLDDEVLEVPARGTSFWLAGLADLWTRQQHVEATIAKIPPGAPTIALTHNPDIFPAILMPPKLDFQSLGQSSSLR